MNIIHNIVIILSLSIISSGIVFPCMNCSIPIADAGNDFDVINGGVGKLDGSGSYDPDNFELQLTYLWYSEEDNISYCSDSSGDSCSEKRYYCEGYDEVFITPEECEDNGHNWVEGIYENYRSCWSAGYITLAGWQSAAGYRRS